MADDSRFPFQSLDAYRVARSFAARVCGASIRDAELRDQATRAAKSAFLNLCEGLPSTRSAVRLKFFDQADGSLHEAVAAVDLADAIGAISSPISSEIHADAFRLRGIIRGLMRASGKPEEPKKPSD